MISLSRGYAVLLPLCALTACNASAPYVTTVGILKPGATLTINVGAANVNAYQPAAGQPRDAFTISATAFSKGTPPPPPSTRPSGRGLTVLAPAPLQSLLVRVPDGVNLVVDSQRGDVNVTDIAGNAVVTARHGNVEIEMPGYAQAQAGVGDLSVTLGATSWPGTLRFSTGRGDVELRISARAAFGVHLHTDDGVLFTDFGLRGTSRGNSETIDGSVNGGASQRIDVETRSGAIRLLRMQPQP